MGLFVSKETNKNIVEWKDVSSWLMWVRVKYGRETWAFVCVCSVGSERSDAEKVFGRACEGNESERENFTAWGHTLEWETNR